MLNDSRNRAECPATMTTVLDYEAGWLIEWADSNISMVLQLKDGSKVMLLDGKEWYRSEDGQSAFVLSGRAFTGHG